MKFIKFSKFSIVLMLLVSFFALSCSKEKGGVTPNVLRKVDKVTYSDGRFYQYTYDANGRCIRDLYKDYTETLVYNGNTVVGTTTNNLSGNVTDLTTYSLNAQGLVTSFTYSSSTDTYLYIDEYNTSGFRTKRTAKRKAITSSVFTTDYEVTYTYDSDNDLIALDQKAISTSYSSVSYKYEYDKNHYNTISNEFAGFDWFGKGSPHVRTKDTYTSSTGSQTITNYTWTYDAKGYNISNSRVGPLAGVTTTVTGTFTYK